MVYKRRIDRRVVDPSIYFRFGKISRLKRASLGDTRRIERARWRALIQFEERIRPKINAVWEKIRELGEAFHCDRSHASDRPVRYVFYEDDRYGGSISADWQFWTRPKSALVGEGPLRDLAEVEEQKEWEHTLKERMARVTEEKLQAGLEYSKVASYWKLRHTRISRLNEMLEASIKEVDILSPLEPLRSAKIAVKINGRSYLFHVVHGCIRGLIKEWPDPGVIDQEISIPEFRIDESLLGKSRSVVRTRHGEPAAVFATHKRDPHENIWIYGAVGLRFSKFDAVDKILTTKEVTSILQQAK